jgi:hypothetical protein
MSAAATVIAVCSTAITAVLGAASGLPAGTALPSGVGWLLHLGPQRLLPLLEALRLQQPLHQLLQACSICQVQVGDLEQQQCTGPGGRATPLLGQAMHMHLCTKAAGPAFPC